MIKVFTSIIFIFFLFVPIKANTPNISILKPLSGSIIIGRDIQFVGEAKNTDQLYINGKKIRLKKNKDFKINKKGGFGKNLLKIQAINFKSLNIQNKNITIFCLKDFPDIKNHWARNEIRLLATYLNLSGRQGSEYFLPDAFITKAELIHLLVILANLKPKYLKKSSYLDVYPSDWFFPYIEVFRAKYGNITRSKTLFSPNGFITRAEIAEIILIYLAKNHKKPPPFQNDVLSNTNKKDRSIRKVIEMGVFPHIWDKQYQLFPFRPITRAEAIAILARLPKTKRKLARFYQKDFEFRGMLTTFAALGIADNTKKKYPIEKYQSNSALIRNVNLKKINKTNNYKLEIKVSKKHKVDRIELDITAIGGIANFEIRDDGAWGDKLPTDNRFTGIIQLPKNPTQVLAVIPLIVYQNNKIIGRGHLQLNLLAHTVKLTKTKPILAIKKRRQIKTNQTTILAKGQQKRIKKRRKKPRIGNFYSAVKKTLGKLGQTKKIYVLYHVEKGDTLPKIARKFSGSSQNWVKIAKYNNLKIQRIETINGELVSCTIFAGRKIKIPRDLIGN